MARLVPPIRPDDIANHGERIVARNLAEQISHPQCVILHSYPWLRPERADDTTLHEGEADFVIIHPEVGMLVLEVKGGEIDYDPESRQWFRITERGKQRIRDPFEQARRAQHYIRNQIVEREFPRERNLPCSFGHCVVFPDSRPIGSPPPGASPATIITSKDLPHLGRRIHQVMASFAHAEKPVGLTPEQAKAIERGLLPLFKLVPDLSRRIESDEQALVRLTEQQQEALEGLYANSRVAVEGIAGSGKTLLAVARAKAFADEGKRTLFACYNKSLAAWLSRQLDGSGVTVRTFHALCDEYAHKARIPFDPAKSKDVAAFWNVEAAAILERALDVVPDRFDAVVVDEGQDVRPAWWIPLQLLNKDAEKGAFYVFFDPAQNLYHAEVEIPDVSVVYRLTKNCRNTAAISRCLENIVGKPIPSMTGSPAGLAPEITECADEKHCAALVRKVVSGWLKTDQLAPSQIAILSPHVRAKSSFADIKSIGDAPLTDDLDTWKRNDGVLFSTIAAFKGLEADAVVVVDLFRWSHALERANLYVACSRAKHKLVMLGADEVLNVVKGDAA
ncbi:MAG: NERD domain-containing protein/DEAD/DEAH box helicase [Planctomycetes bacterium]|nr:NERD domain-containing protein/DEAD/DEAH box helicase [Planctomycetota bacterium]